MRRRSLAAVAAFALVAAGVAPVLSRAAGAAFDTSNGPSPAAAIVAAHVSGAGARSAGPTVFGVDAQSILTVTTTADDGSVGSLRDVIQNQAVSGGGDVVVLAAGATYVLTCAEGGDLEHGSTALDIQGNGATITMEAACEEGILVNGTGALVIRDVQFTGLDLTPAAGTTAIVETGGPFTLVGGRVADNVVGGGKTLDGFFYKTAAAAGDVLVDGTVFERNARDVGSDCALFCVIGDVEIRNATFVDTTVDATSACGALVCISGDLEIRDSSISASTNLGTSHCGGLVCIDGDTRFTRTTVAGTSSQVRAPGSVCGGLVCTSRGMTMTDSSVTATTASGSAATACGAGLLCGNDDVELVRSTFSGSGVQLTGGGGSECGSIICTDGGLAVVNSTVADNTTTGGAQLPGAFTLGDEVVLAYATFVGNAGSGIPALAPYDTESVDASIFASALARSGTAGACSPDLAVMSHGYNFADDTSCGLTGTGDRQAVGANPQLGELVDNGGPGPTMLPAMSSPLVDGVPAAACQSDGAAGITTDERGLPRPSVLGSNCDIGAVELQPPAVKPTPLVPTFTG